MWEWPQAMGGNLLGRPRTRITDRGSLDIRDFSVAFPSLATILSASFRVSPELNPIRYRFDYRRDDVLLWRADCHTGHEAEFGGPHHLHLGPTEHVRVASPAYSLQDIADLVIRTNISLER